MDIWLDDKQKYEKLYGHIITIHSMLRVTLYVVAILLTGFALIVPLIASEPTVALFGLPISLADSSIG